MQPSESSNALHKSGYLLDPQKVNDVCDTFYIYIYLLIKIIRFIFHDFLFRQNGMKLVKKLLKSQQNHVQNVEHQLKEMVV